jgi:hypothetical protein
MASVGRVACNSTPAVGLSAQTERQSRGTVLPVFIGFLRQFAECWRRDPARNLRLAGCSPDRMILLTFTACLIRWFRFALDRHNFATGFFLFA